MNTKDKNISKAASDRRTYLSPCVQIIKMNTSNLVMGSPSPLEIPVDPTPGATDANGKRWQGDDLDSWDEADGCNDKSWGIGW